MSLILCPTKTIATIETLKARIEERFPSSGLGRVCGELCNIANDSEKRGQWIAEPNYWLRALVGVIVLAIAMVLVYSISQMDITFQQMSAAEIVQLTEAALNDLILIGAAAFFLISVEIRIKRSRVLEALHEIRTITHVIDMHQLTKDPSRLQKNVILTDSSPQEDMTAYELLRYLDYCSEMLSLAGKIAALYAENLRDPAVLSAVNEIENLTTGLSRKIWQKIMILQKLDENNFSTLQSPLVPT